VFFIAGVSPSLEIERQVTISHSTNAFGLYDTTGNVMSWTQGCWHKNYNGAPTDGSAWTVGDCGEHVTRGGGAWQDSSYDLRAARRYKFITDITLSFTESRIARAN
jgi:formylglycine-generating enzyme required for sulfatase activity